MTDDILIVRRLSDNTGDDKKNIRRNKRKKERKKKEQARPRTKKDLSSKPKRKLDKYRTMSYLTTQKMLRKLLTCDRVDPRGERRAKYTREELAEELGITLLELKKLESYGSYKNTAEKVTLPLVSLYCSIRWVHDRKKKKFYE